MATNQGSTGTATWAGSAPAELLDFSFDEGVEIVDTSNLAAAADTHTAGSTNWSGSMTCYWDETDSSGQDAMTIGASGAIVWKPNGGGSGSDIHTGVATIESIGIAITRNGTTSRTYGLKGNGALVISQVA